MIVELNLVRTTSLFSTYGRELARKRVEVTENTVLESVIKFLGDNSDVLDQVTKNANFIDQITHMTDLTIDKLQSLRYILADHGVDLLVWAVAEKESGLEGVPEDAVEYNVVDMTNMFGSFIPFVTKLVVNRADMNVSAVYSRIKEMFSLFEGEPFTDSMDPLVQDIKVMKEQEQLFGAIPEAISMHANSVLEFLGKKLYAISN